MTPPAPSVRFAPPPEHLIPDLQHSINNALSTLRADQRGALILVGTKDGDTVKFNAAIVARIDEHWAVEAWMAKSWGQSVSGGATVQASW